MPSLVPSITELLLAPRMPRTDTLTKQYAHGIAHYIRVARGLLTSKMTFALVDYDGKSSSLLSADPVWTPAGSVCQFLQREYASTRNGIVTRLRLTGPRPGVLTVMSDDNINVHLVALDSALVAWVSADYRDPLRLLRKIFRKHSFGKRHDCMVASLEVALNPFGKFAARFCAACLGDGSGKLLLCGVCQVTPYCSRECQASHYKWHKRYCERLPEGVVTARDTSAFRAFDLAFQQGLPTS